MRAERRWGRGPSRGPLPPTPIDFLSLPRITGSALLAAALSFAPRAAAEEPAAPIEKNDAPIDVLVEGDRGLAPRATRDPAVASYVVRGDALKRPGGTAVQAIEASPGVEGSRSGAGSDLATVSIRGAPSAHLPVYLAGVRLNDDVTGAADLSTVPLFALDRVEVYRGNAPADADRLGIAGALFLEPRLPRGTRAGATASYGSFGALSLGAFASLGDDRSGALFALSHQRATNDYRYADDGGTPDPADDRELSRQNGDAASFDAWALGRTTLPGGGRLVLLANAFAREQGVVGPIYAPVHEVRSAVRRELAAASVRVACAGASPATESALDRCSLEIASSAVTSRRTLTDPLGELGLPGRTSIAGQRWQESARLRLRAGDALELRAGLHAGVDRLGVDLPSGPATRAARLSVTGSLSAAWDATERVTLFAVGAGECHTPFGDAERGGACAAGGPAGRAGLRVKLPLGVEVSASGGSYVRVPTLGELFGLSAAVLGNPDLGPERGFTGELSARWSAGTSSGSARWYADLTGFGRYAEGLIAYRLTRVDQIKPFNVGAARILGAEALLGADLASHVRGEVSVTLQDPRDVSPDRKPIADLLPFHAEATLGSTLEVYTDLRRCVHILGPASLGLSFRYRSARSGDPAAQIRLAEVRDLGVDASASLLGGALTVRFSARDLLDLPDQDLLGFALPGRSFYGGVEAIW